MIKGEHPDEIFMEDDTLESDIPRTERILRLFEDVLQSDEFNKSTDEFVEKNCEHFTEHGDLGPECMNIYTEYINMIEKKLLSKVTKLFPDFNFEELVPIIKNYNSEDFVHADVLEILSAMSNFESFRDLMVSYNKGADLDIGAIITKL